MSFRPLSLFLAAPSARHGHLDALDGLRGLAVLIVLLSHLSNAGMHLIPGLSLSGTGKSGVYLFFVLSAFLLTRALVEKPLSALARTRLWANYALRRVLRIWPLYLVVLLLSAGLTQLGQPAWWHYSLDPAALWRHLLLRDGQSVLWSIPVEFKYYGLLPFVAAAFACARAYRLGWWLEAGMFALALLAATAWWPPAQAGDNDVRLGPYLALFLCGAYAAALQVRLAEAGDRIPSWLWSLLAVGVSVALVLTVPTIWYGLIGGEVNYQLNHRWFVFFGLLWGVAVLAVVNGPRWVRAPFASRAMRLLGVVSFSAYLWHMVILDAMRAAGWSGLTLSPWGFLLATWLVSLLSYLAFERPWRDVYLRRR